MLNLPFGQIGKVIKEPRLMIKDTQKKTVVDSEISKLKEAWQKPLALG